MKRTLALTTILILLAPACSSPDLGGSTPGADAPSITPPISDLQSPISTSPCGDGVCDAAEQANPNLCPMDCGDAEPAPLSSPEPPTTNQPPPTTAPEIEGPEADPGAEMYLRETADPLEHEVYLAQINAVTSSDSAWQYQTSLVATMPSGEEYDMGAFCRTFQRADGNGYDVVYGGTFRNHATGETRYSGDVYRSLGNDFSFTTTPLEFSDRGGDW